MRRGNNEARAIVEKTLVFFEASLSSANAIEKSFETTANRSTKGSSGLAETKAEIKYPANTVTRTCIMDETQETSVARVLDELNISILVPSSFFTEW
jgi:hypothetical protein